MAMLASVIRAMKKDLDNILKAEIQMELDNTNEKVSMLCKFATTNMNHSGVELYKYIVFG